jgi:thioesterase domain-containing protein/acyl carrier protein
VYEVPPGVVSAGSVPIGRPIANTQLYVLDPQGQPVPIGVPGELYIGGDGLARGYHRRPQLTADRFVPNPFALDASARLYRTGDLVRWRADGNLDFLGRLDHQVKIRGFRVELGEIEAILGRHSRVREVVVVAREDVPGEKRLVAYIVPRGKLPELTVSELRDYLHEKAPDYMVPSAFVMVKELPQTPNGKIDRKELPAPDAERPRLDHEYVGPRTQLEETLAEIWAEALNLRTVGIHDNFFDLGGHSLLAVKLFTRVENVFGKKLPLATLFEHPSIAGVARILQQPRRPNEQGALVKIHGAGARPPLFFTPSAGGEALFLKPLACHLGADQPIWSFQIPEEGGGRKPFHSIETMAAFFVNELTRSQINGPYCLAGYSFGAAVALEMAQQLLAQGDRVAFLALIDWGFSPPKPRTIGRLLRSAWASLRNLPYWLADDFLRTQRKHMRARLASKLREVVRRIRDPLNDGSKSSSGTGAAYDPWLASLGSENRLVIETHERALERYRPRPYPGRFTLFRSRAQGLLTSLHNHDLGMGRLSADGVDVEMIPGNHVTMMQEPFVRILTRGLRHALDKDVARSRAERSDS